MYQVRASESAGGSVPSSARSLAIDAAQPVLPVPVAMITPDDDWRSVAPPGTVTT